MHGYHVALFVHLLALLAAFSASSLVHFAMTRVRDARTGAEALQWLGLCHRLSRVFPVALLTLVASGAWMTHDLWTWDTGFVDAGLTGAVLLLLSGAGVEGGRARRVAASLAAAPGDRPGEAVRDPLWWAASWANTGTALGVVFAMAAKPSAAGSFAGVAIGLVAGVCVGLAARGSQGPARTKATSST
jgi:hypothetical protein